MQFSIEKYSYRDIMISDKKYICMFAITTAVSKQRASIDTWKKVT